MLNLLRDLMGCHRERSDDIRNRVMTGQHRRIDAFGAQLEPFVRPPGEEWNKSLGETGYGLHRQGIAGVARKIAGRPIGSGLMLFNGRLKVFKVHKIDIVRRSIHPLEKAITAVVEAIQHVAEIVILSRSDRITLRRRQNQVSVLLSENQPRALFLKSEILGRPVEDLTIAFALDDLRAGKSIDYFQRSRMIPDRIFYVDRVHSRPASDRQVHDLIV